MRAGRGDRVHISVDQLDADEKKHLLEALLAERDRPEAERLLSFAQERLWFLDRFQPGLSVYNLPLTLLFPGELDAEALRRALGEVVRRHQVLRTVFRTVDGEPRQLVRPPSDFALPLVDLLGIEPERRAAEEQQLAAAEAGHLFDLADGPLFRATLVRTASDRHLLLLNMHHIVSDGWSTGILVREIGAIYQAYAAGRTSPLAEPAMQYADFAEQQRARLSGAALERHLSYWRTQLADAPPVLDLPADRPRPQVQSFNGAWQSFALDSGLVPLCAGSRAKPAHLVHGPSGRVQGPAVPLHQCRRHPHRNADRQPQPFGDRRTDRILVNTLVLRSRVSGDMRFDALLASVRDSTLDSYAHQDLPFEKLVEEMQPERNPAHNPLFQVMFTLQNMPGSPPTAAPAQEEAGVFLGTSKFDLTWALAEAGGQLGGTCEYSTDLFDHDRIGRMIGHF